MPGSLMPREGGSLAHLAHAHPATLAHHAGSLGYRAGRIAGPSAHHAGAPMPSPFPADKFYPPPLAMHGAPGKAFSIPSVIHSSLHHSNDFPSFIHLYFFCCCPSFGPFDAQFYALSWHDAFAIVHVSDRRIRLRTVRERSSSNDFSPNLQRSPSLSQNNKQINEKFCVPFGVPRRKPLSSSYFCRHIVKSFKVIVQSARTSFKTKRFVDTMSTDAFWSRLNMVACAGSYTHKPTTHPVGSC